MMAPIWQAIIGAVVPIVVMVILAGIASYFDNGWILGIGIAVYFISNILVAFLIGNRDFYFAQGYPIKNIAITSLIHFGIMFCALFIGAMFADDSYDEERTFAISFIVTTLLVSCLSVVLINDHINSLNRVFLETDEVNEIKYELSCDENGKFIYYASQNASEEGYYVVIYKKDNEYKPLKIKESKLTILDSVEVDEKNYLVEIQAIHKKICTNNDDVETETKIVTTYKVYVPGGAANIGFITAN